MIRILNFFCVALAGLACLALYRVSEQARIADAQLHRIDRQIVVERNALHVLEADWQSVAAPDRIQRLAEAKLGISDTTTAQLSSFELLPRRGEDAPIGDARIQQASAQVPAVVSAPQPEPQTLVAEPQTQTLAVANEVPTLAPTDDEPAAQQ
jgi:hypothetical protein